MCSKGFVLQDKLRISYARHGAHGFASQLVPFLKSFGSGLKHVDLSKTLESQLIIVLKIGLEEEGGVYDPTDYARAIENIVINLCDAFHGQVLSNENIRLKARFVLLFTLKNTNAVSVPMCYKAILVQACSPSKQGSNQASQSYRLIILCSRNVLKIECFGMSSNAPMAMLS